MKEEKMSGGDEDMRQLIQRDRPDLDFMGMYGGRVVRQKTSADGDMRIDMELDVDFMPNPAGLKLKLGIPGAVVDLEGGTAGRESGVAGARAMLAFEDFDPGKPYVLGAWENGSTPPAKLVLNAVDLFLGGEQLAEATIKAETYRSQESVLNQQIITLATAAAAACSSPTLTPLAPFFSGLASAFQAFEAQAATYLTTVVKVK